MTELEWFLQFCGPDEDVTLFNREEVIHDICNILAILGTEGLPEQPEGTTVADLADKILAQAREERDDG